MNLRAPHCCLTFHHSANQDFYNRCRDMYGGSTQLWLSLALSSFLLHWARPQNQTAAHCWNETLVPLLGLSRNAEAYPGLVCQAISSYVIVCGDFNCLIMNNDNVCSRLNDSLTSADLEQHVHAPTRGHLHNFGSRPHFISSYRRQLLGLWPQPGHRSNQHWLRSNSIHQMFRNLKNFDASQFHSSLRR